MLRLVAAPIDGTMGVSAMECLPDDPNFRAAELSTLYTLGAPVRAKNVRKPRRVQPRFFRRLQDGFAGRSGIPMGRHGHEMRRSPRRISIQRPAYDYAVIRRTADAIIKRLMPLKSMATPTSVPTAQALLAGHVLMIMNASRSVMVPLNRSHPDPFS